MAESIRTGIILECGCNEAARSSTIGEIYTGAVILAVNHKWLIKEEEKSLKHLIYGITSKKEHSKQTVKDCQKNI